MKLSDTGMGIPPDILLALFKKFMTNGLNEVQNNKGAGLAACISKAIVGTRFGKIEAFNNH